MAVAIADSRASDMLSVSAVRTDGGTQPRAALYQNVIDDYADSLSNDASFPAIIVYFDGTDYWLADGFHRHGAHVKAGREEILSDIRQGTRREAILYSVGANASHGLRRTNEDKRRAVMTLLQDDEWVKWSDREIARRAGVGAPLVGDLRKSICNPITDTPRLVERNGVTYTQNTANIGRPAQPAKPVVLASSDPAPLQVVDEATQPSLQSPDPSNDNSPAAYRTSFTGNNEWYTPARYVDLARIVMGRIDVDPASNDFAQQTVKSATFYTAETNGLDKEWRGKIWMNPPYSQPEIVHFIEKAIAEYETGRAEEIIILTHNSTDTAWFDMLFKRASAICFTKGRVRFVSPQGEFAAPAMGQAFTYFGANPHRFAEVFSEVGNVWGPSCQQAA